jgi:cytochrome c
MRSVFSQRARLQGVLMRLKCLLPLALSLLTVALPLSTLAGAPDGAMGQKTFNMKCAACHTNAAGARNGVGPNLFGLYTRKGGTTPGYASSAAMKASGITWTDATLSQWLDKPLAMVPRNKMGIAPPLKPDEKANLIAYLKSQK